MVLGLTQKSISKVSASKMSGGGDAAFAVLAGTVLGRGAGAAETTFAVLLFGGGELAQPPSSPPAPSASDC